MYQRSLNILIAAEDPQLMASLETVPAQERFSHHFTHKPVDATTDFGAYPIVVLDLDAIAPDLIDQIVQNKDSQSILVAHSSAGSLPVFAHHLHHFDAVWAKPMDQAALQASFKTLLARLKAQEDATLTAKYLETLIDSLPELIWFKDVRGAHLKINDSFCKTVGKSKAQIEGRGHYYIWDIEPDEYADGEYICLESEEIVLEKQETCLFDETVKCGDEMRKFKTYKSPIFDCDGSVLGTVGFAHDATDLQNLMVELNILLEGLPFAVLVTDKSKVITNVNQKFIDIFAQKKEDLIGLSATDLFNVAKDNQQGWSLHADDGQTLLRAQNRVLKLHDEQLLDVFGIHSGHIYLFLDITLEHREKTRLQNDANTDFLTKLNNRRCMQEFLQKQPLQPDTALMLVDLDNFKEVNDRFGHDEGDRVLVAFARMLKQMYPAENLFRLGGDEFAIILPNIRDEGALDACQDRLLSAFDRNIARNFVHTNIAASVGVAVDGHNADSFNDLFKRADTSLYRVKRAKKAA